MSGSTYDLYIAIGGGFEGVFSAEDSISILSSSGQAIAGIVSAIAPIGGAVAINPAAGLITLVKIGVDADQRSEINIGDALSVVGNSVSVTAAFLAVVPGGQPIALPLVVVGRAMALAGIGVSLLDVNYPINADINTTYRTAATTRPAPIWIDPLAIDLDGDGIETIGIGSTPVTFDHNADGVRTGSGWLKGDDAWLVMDRDGNGSIDSGRELFGVDYVKTSNQFATSGLDALRDLDSNADGVFNGNDAAFAQVKLWQDLNQDGVSQANELFALADKGIASIGLNGTAANTNLGNGNTVGATAVVTRSDGSTTTAADLNLAHNPFFRRFTTDVPVSQAAQGLPQMGGAGWVRDLREAMSLGTAQAQALLADVQAFASATTKAEQLAQLDALIRHWAATNEHTTLNNPQRRFVVANDPTMSARLQAIVPLLEVFNGLDVSQAGMQAPVISTVTLADGTTQQVQTYTLFAEQVQPMLNAYEQLRQSVYGALVMQTRLKPYLEAVELVSVTPIFASASNSFGYRSCDQLLTQVAGR